MLSGRLVPAAHAAALTLVAIAIAVLAAAVAPDGAGAKAGRALASPAATLLPPANPRYSVGFGKYNPPGCSGIHDYSAACMRQSLAMINAGRRSEDLGPVVLPSNWQQLTVSRQLFVLTELERTARGLQADRGLSADLNDVAVAGAAAGRDPTGSVRGFGSLWAGGEPNPIAVMADWIYEDGLFADGFATENLTCSATATADCWQHRDILLHDGDAGSCGARCALGAGYSPSGYSRAAATGTDSYAEVVARSDSGAQTFTWASELARLPLCEQAGDTCTWTGSPVATAAGIVTMGGTRATAKPTLRSPSKPWFALHVSCRLSGRGQVSLSIHAAIRLFGVRAVARRARTQKELQVSGSSASGYTATGRLPAGRWTITIVYRARARGRQPISRVKLVVP